MGYNGFGRVDGDSQGGGGGGRGAPVFRGQPFRGPAPGGAQAAAPSPFNGPGGIVAGTPGPWRMFDASNGDQIAWLLPFAIGSGLIALWYWRRDPTRRAFAVLFLGWVALYGGVFSNAQGIFHTYYTSAMAPGIAALTGIGVVTLAHAIRRDRRWLAAAIGLICLDRVGATRDRGPHA